METMLFHNLRLKLNLSSSQLSELIDKAPLSYKIYSIPKKNGGKRIIAHPSKNLKKIQKALLQLLEQDLLIHESASAYIKGKSIINNASVHKYNKFLLKLDFHDFFHSINNSLFIKYLESIDLCFSEEDLHLISHIFFWNPNRKDKTHKKLILSIGAPSSPKISNAVMYFFDHEIEKYCSSKLQNYSRYADDISISGNNKEELKNTLSFIRRKLYQLFGGRLILNELKTVFVSSGANKFITGITLTTQGNLSIGRKRKKYIFSLVYQYSINSLKEDMILHLRGLISFSRSVEPSFLLRLESKYGKEIIERILNDNKYNRFI